MGLRDSWVRASKRWRGQRAPLRAHCIPFFCAIVVLSSALALACNIPVFRYALERWKPDAAEVVVVYDQPISEAEQQKLEQLRGGAANLTITTIDSKTTDARQRDLVAVAILLSENQLPYVLVRTTVNAERTAMAWTGPLKKLSPDTLLDSPARRELARRLIKGDAVVWVVVKSTQAERNTKLKELLTTELKKLSKTIPFPEGLGLPGSELFSEVPLLMQFTMLEIDPSDKREEFLVNLFRGFDPQAVKDDQPLVVPVFGRGRALEVLSADRLDAGLIGDLSRYLCGACSCQVKERNPGFDLLLQATWERDLFGEDGQLPPPPKEYDPNTAPSYVPIPSGKK